MLVQKVATTPDPTLPLYLPELPNAVTHRWVADSLLTDGAQIVPPVVGSISLTDGSGGATTVPDAGLVDGLRALTFDGTADQGYALNANPGPGGTVSMYAVVKMTSDPAATRSIVHWNTQWLGFNSARKFTVGSAVLPTAFAVGSWYVIGGSIKRNTGTGDAEWRIACHNGETAQVLSQNQAALSTFAAFGVGSGSSKTPMVARDLALNVGAAHTTAQLLANCQALAEEYGIA